MGNWDNEQVSKGYEPPDISPGMYPFTFVGVDAATGGGFEGIEFAFDVKDDPVDDPVRLEKVAWKGDNGYSTGPKSTLRAMFIGIVGRQPTEQEDPKTNGGRLGPFMAAIEASKGVTGQIMIGAPEEVGDKPKILAVTRSK